MRNRQAKRWIVFESYARMRVDAKGRPVQWTEIDGDRAALEERLGPGEVVMRVKITPARRRGARMEQTA